MQLAKQHYYSKDTRERVCHLHVIEGFSYKQISDFFGGRPCEKTVGTIVREWKATGEVHAVAGQKGTRKKRRFDEHAAQARSDRACPGR